MAIELIVACLAMNGDKLTADLQLELVKGKEKATNRYIDEGFVTSIRANP